MNGVFRVWDLLQKGVDCKNPVKLIGCARLQEDFLDKVLWNLGRDCKGYVDRLDEWWKEGHECEVGTFFAWLVSDWDFAGFHF